MSRVNWMNWDLQLQVMQTPMVPHDNLINKINPELPGTIELSLILVILHIDILVGNIAIYRYVSIYS